MARELIPIVAILMPILMVMMILTLKHRQQRRELQYRERMKAMELGLGGPATGTWPAALAAICIGAGVPIGCFLVAWFATMTSHAREEAFLGATVVGLVAVVQGSRLAIRLAGWASSESASEPNHAATVAHHHANGKPPVYDPDAFDVVSRRG